MIFVCASALIIRDIQKNNRADQQKGRVRNRRHGSRTVSQCTLLLVKLGTHGGIRRLGEGRSVTDRDRRRRIHRRAERQSHLTQGRAKGF